MTQSLSIIKRTLLGLIIAPWLVVNGLADTSPFNASQVANNIAIVNVGDDGVTIDLEIFFGDLGSFSDLLPARLFSKTAGGARDDAQRLARFALNGISLRRGDGSLLPLTVQLIEPRLRVDRSSPVAGQRDPLSGRAVPAPPDDPRVVFVRLFYSFEGQKPDVIQLLPPRDNEGVPVVIGAHVSDRGLPVSEFRFFAQLMRLHINWEDPWYTQFSDPSLNRRMQEATTGFLYVEPREVRVETLVRLRDLSRLIGHDFKMNSALDPEDQQEVLAAAQAFLKTRNALQMDGHAKAPRASRASFLNLGERGFEVVQDDQDTSANAAFVGVVVSYPIEALPQRVAVLWDVFSEAQAKVPIVITDVASPFFSDVTKDRAEILWTNQLLTYRNLQIETLPLGDGVSRIDTMIWTGLAAFLAGGGIVFLALGKSRRTIAVICTMMGLGLGSLVFFQPSRLPLLVFEAPGQEETSQLLSKALSQINLATLEPSPEFRRTALAPIVVQEALLDVAAEIERGVAIRLPGGGIARVTSQSDVDVQSVSPLAEGRGMQALVTWQSQATGGHWGHRHTRTVEYRALVDLVAFGGLWKISGLTVLESQMSSS
ncbi:hypothetical protein [Roseibium sp.]|uniref:hypothetical protein n=1 Tax=Roseibium sp. TaxID=1936156 RepID=UPI003BA99926